MIIQWIPGHSIIPGNDLAEEYAKAIAQSGESTRSPLTYDTARAIIRREIKNPLSKHPTVSNQSSVKKRRRED